MQRQGALLKKPCCKSIWQLLPAVFNSFVEGILLFALMRKITLCDASGLIDTLSEDERRALRGSRFALLHPHPPDEVKVGSRVAHPGGPLATNKAAALAKFLQRKLNESSGSANLDPVLVEAAVKNAKDALHGLSANDLRVRHVESFSGSDKDCDTTESKEVQAVGQNKKKKKKQKCKRTLRAKDIQAVGLKKKKKKKRKNKKKNV